MSDMFEENISQEELDFLISNILDIILDEYALKNVPVNGSLEACLDAYTKVKLIKLADENGIEVKQNWKKARIVETLRDGIIDSIDERFLILQRRGLILLQYMSEGKFTLDEYVSEHVEFMVTVFQSAVRLGLLYTSEENDEVTMTMPNLVKAKLDEALEHFDVLQDEYRSELEFWDQMNEVLIAGINLYGVMTAFDFHDLWEIRYPEIKSIELEEMREKYFYLAKYLPFLIIRNGFISDQKYLIASSQFVDTEDALNFYNFRANKIGSIYYEPTKEEIIYYADHSFDQRTLEYKKLKQEVFKMTKDVEMYMHLIETSIQSGEDISELLESTAELGIIEFQSEEQFIRFMDLYTNLNNNSRLWENGGFTPSELIEQVSRKYNFPDGFLESDFDSGDFESGNIISLDTFRREKDKE